MSGPGGVFCRVCDAKFATARSARAHRAGSWGDQAFPRRCRTEAEMIAGGMWQTKRGVWHGEWTESPGKGNAWQGRGGSKGDAA